MGLSIIISAVLGSSTLIEPGMTATLRQEVGETHIDLWAQHGEQEQSMSRWQADWHEEGFLACPPTHNGRPDGSDSLVRPAFMQCWELGSRKEL